MARLQHVTADATGTWQGEHREDITRAEQACGGSHCGAPHGDSEKAPFGRKP